MKKISSTTIEKQFIVYSYENQELLPLYKRKPDISFTIKKYFFPNDRNLISQKTTIDTVLERLGDFLVEHECIPNVIECVYVKSSQTYEGHIDFRGIISQRLVEALRKKGEIIHNWTKDGFTFEGVTFTT